MTNQNQDFTRTFEKMEDAGCNLPQVVRSLDHAYSFTAWCTDFWMGDTLGGYVCDRDEHEHIRYLRYGSNDGDKYGFYPEFIFKNRNIFNDFIHRLQSEYKEYAKDGEIA
jgi:hypothetical protein